MVRMKDAKAVNALLKSGRSKNGRVKDRVDPILSRAPAASANGHGRRTVKTLNPEKLLTALTAFKEGDFSYRLPGSWVGVEGKIADTFNDIIERNQRMVVELARLS